MMRKFVVTAAAIVFATACGAYQFPAGSHSPSSASAAVSGRVVAVPCAPVERAGQSCAGRPVPDVELDYLQGGHVAVKAFTDSHGAYSVALEPGSYTVKLNTYLRVLSGPLTMSVSAGSTLVADYTLDSGIRVPQPQWGAHSAALPTSTLPTHQPPTNLPTP